MENTTQKDKMKSWVDEYSDNLFSWAFYKTSSKETAEDIVQDTFIAAFKSIDKFEGRSNPKTWLFSILNNKITDYHRNNFRKGALASPDTLDNRFDSDGVWKSDEAPLLWSTDEEHLLDNPEFKLVLDKCLQKLPSTWYSAIQYKYLEEKESSSICQELDITPTNFWQILHRAKLQLRKCIESGWIKK